MAITKKKSSTAKKSSSGVTTLPYKGGTPTAQKLPYTGGTPSIQKLPYKGGTSSIKKASSGSSTKKSGTAVGTDAADTIIGGAVKTLAGKNKASATKKVLKKATPRKTTTAPNKTKNEKYHIY